MSFQINQQDIKEIIFHLVEVFNQEKDYLNDLDSKIGDGDHGLSMSRGFNAIVKYLKNNPNLSISDILSQGGIQFNEATGSTIGILIFSGMRSAGLTVKDRESIDLSDLINILGASIEAIQKRGKASIGQKTILDSLIPTLKYLKSQEEKNDESEIVKEAIQVAFQGAESTKELESQIGRANWFKERSIGIMDPGAYSGYLMIKAVGEYILRKYH